MIRPATYRTTCESKRLCVWFAVAFICSAGKQSYAQPQLAEGLPVVGSAQPVQLETPALVKSASTPDVGGTVINPAPQMNLEIVTNPGPVALDSTASPIVLAPQPQLAPLPQLAPTPKLAPTPVLTPQPKITPQPLALPATTPPSQSSSRPVPQAPLKADPTVASKEETPKTTAGGALSRLSAEGFDGDEGLIETLEVVAEPVVRELTLGLDLIESPPQILESEGEPIQQMVELPVSQPLIHNASEWRLFDDPVLQEMIDRVVSQNPSVRDAQARITQARAIYQQARADLFPQVNATSQYGFRRFSQNGNAFVQDSTTTQGFDWYSGGLDTRWEVDLFGRLRSLRNAAGLETDAAKQDCRDVMLSLVGDLMLAYIEFSLANERLRIANENLNVQGRILAIAQERRRIGEEGDLVVMQAQNQVDMTRTLIPGIQEQRATALHRLMVLQGFGMETPTAPTHWGTQLPQLPTHLPLQIDGELLARRPDVRSNRLAVLAQAERVGASRAEFYPKLMLNGSVSLETRDLSVWWDERSLAHSVGPVLSLNLLDFGRLRAGVNAERSKYAQAVARYEQSVLEAVEEVRNAMASSDAQRERTSTLDTAAKSALSVVEMATVEYQEGMTNFQNVLDAERQLLSIQDQKAVAHGTALIAYARLFKALGGTWVEGLPGEAGLIHDSMSAQSTSGTDDLVR